MGRCPIPRQRGLFVKSPLWIPEKQCFTFNVWLFIASSQGFKGSAYTPPIRLRRRNALVQRVAKSTRKSQPSVAGNYQAGFCSQGIKRPAYMPPIRLRRRNALVQRVAKSTRKSQPSVAGNYQAGFCSQGIKRPARMSPAFDGLYF